jgi:ribosomal protein S18 acetylase RimI-like enzyme
VGVVIEISDGTEGPSVLDEVRPLSFALREHHRAVSTYRYLNPDEDGSWELRRALYLRVLLGGGILVTAKRDGELVGYAVVSAEPGNDDTFDVGSGVGEIITLVVGAAERDKGVGSLLIREIGAWAAGRGLAALRVAVMDGNERAVRFYDRAGFELAEHVLYRRLEPPEQ